jgi:hypothetical protein
MCALTSEGGVYCWGNNSGGQLGVGHTNSAQNYLPYPVEGFSSGAVDLGVGNQHSCLLPAIGGAKCFGNNNYGQLGSTSTPLGFTPDPFDVVVPELPVANASVKQISGGAVFTCALLSADGSVRCWGDNSYNQQGNSFGAAGNAVIGLSGVQAIATGSSHACAITATSGLVCWGSNSYGEQGNGTLGTIAPGPTPVVGLTYPIGTVSAGSGFGCATDSQGTVWCWGAYYTGNAAFPSSSIPVRVQLPSGGGLNVGQASQVISFPALPANVVPTTLTLTVLASASSGLPVTLETQPLTSTVCQITGTSHVVSLVGTGTCTLVATQSGNGAFAPAASVTQSFTVSKLPQAISNFASSPSTLVYGGPSATLSATGGASGNPVTFAVVPQKSGSI